MNKSFHPLTACGLAALCLVAPLGAVAQSSVSI